MQINEIVTQRTRTRERKTDKMEAFELNFRRKKER